MKGLNERNRPVVHLDDLDHRIIAELRRDGRQANTEIARRLSVSETTIRNRIQRLVKAGVIQVAAFTYLPSLGYVLNVLIGVSCDAGRAVEIARALATMPEIRWLAHVTGRYNLMVAAFFRSQDELFTFLTEQLGKVPGIQRTETLHVLRVDKRDFDYWTSTKLDQA